VFTTPLPLAVDVIFRAFPSAGMFSDPLPRNGHGADHIGNTSRNTFSIIACAYFGRCLEMGLHVTELSSHLRTAFPSGFEAKIQNAFLGSYM
jgi:hypothetical protein